MDGIDGWGYGCGEDGRNLPKGLLISLYLSRRMGGSSLIRSCEAPMVREVLVRRSLADDEMQGRRHIRFG